MLDILRAVDAIEAHLSRGPLTDGLVFDAVRVRLIARMRDVLAHHYFDTSHAILQQTVRHDLPRLRMSVVGLLEGLE